MNPLRNRRRCRTCRRRADVYIHPDIGSACDLHITQALAALDKLDESSPLLAAAQRRETA